MLRTQRIGFGKGDEPLRWFDVPLLDESPQRSEAVGFFNSLDRPMTHQSILSDDVKSMTDPELKDYLKNNPQREKFSLLRASTRDGVNDDDFRRLEFLPELEHLILYGVGNAALSHLRFVRDLDTLVVYSDKIDDHCLSNLLCLRRLRCIDFQSSPNVSKEAFADTVDSLSSLIHSYPPNQVTG